MVVEKKKVQYGEYEAFITRAENADKLFELINGEIVEKMPSYEPSHIAGWILTFINMYLLQNEIGYTTTADGGYILDDDNTLIPDVGYISKARMPEIPDREVPTYPDLAIEVMSPTDRKRGLRLKAEKYLSYGTKMVWLVFPDEQQVEVYTPDEDVIMIGVDGTLDGRDVLPGFKLAVKDIFK